MLYLVFFASDPRRFVPVYFSRLDSAISQPHASDPLAFAPAAPPVDFTQPGDLANARARGESLNAGNFAQNLEAHQVIVSPSRDSVNVGRSHFLLANDREGAADSVERLMGTKAEFASHDLLDV